MVLPDAVRQRIEHFDRNQDRLKSAEYKEAEVRREFLDPLFKALGWDMDNERGHAEPYKEVIHEARLKIGGGTKAPDYCFRVGTDAKFYVEAKKPSVNVRQDPSSAYQLRRYAWSKGLPVSILTDFEEFAVYDTTVEPKPGDSAGVARLTYIKYSEYEDRWSEIEDVFSREAVWQGSFDSFAKPTRSRRGQLTVDKAFLRDLRHWREEIAAELARKNDLDQESLNYSVQQILDRIIFLRIAEDRGIEPYGGLKGLLKSAKGSMYHDLVRIFRQADSYYNSGLFHFKKERGREAPDTLTPSLEIGDRVLYDFIERLYYPYPYEFSAIPADILGQVYEQFLGTTITLTTGRSVKTEEKPEVKKAGGIVYTPTFVVDSIVERALSPLLSGTDPERLRQRGFSVIDPACGSGTFLLQAYQYLLDWHLDSYSNDVPRWMRSRPPRLYDDGGFLRLTTAERKRILISYIYGVDIDSRAVEVTKLSLLLKVLEGETSSSLESQLELFAQERALPDLGKNIQSGNALVGHDLAQHVASVSADARLRVRAFDWASSFPGVFDGRTPGFDALIANPPYVLLQADFRDKTLDEYYRSRYKVAKFKLDTYHLFIERSLEITKKKGMVSMIVPSNFLTNNYLDALRAYLLERSSLQEILVVDGGVFEGRSVDNAILTTQAGAPTKGGFVVSYAIPASGSLKPYSEVVLKPGRIKADPAFLFTGGDNALADLWDAVVRPDQILGNVASVNFGKQLRDRRQHPDDVLRLTPGAAVPPTHRECYSGEDVTRYHVHWSGYACLQSTVAQRGGTWDPAVQDAANKILTRQIGRSPAFALDTVGRQVLNNTFMIIPNDPTWSAKAMLALLNSAFVEVFWIDRFWDRRRTFPKVKGTFLKRIPVPAIDDAQVGELERLATERLDAAAKALRASTPNAQRAAKDVAAQLDAEIDEATEKAYELTAGQRQLLHEKKADLRAAVARLIG